MLMHGAPAHVADDTVDHDRGSVGAGSATTSVYVGAHAFSRDAIEWVLSTVPPYTTVINFTNGSQITMRRRERPELLLSAAGQPRFFSSGVEDYGDHVFTLVVGVASGDSRGASSE